MPLRYDTSLRKGGFVNNTHFDIDTEAVVLMELMLYPSKENVNSLSDIDFHRDLHRWIFEAIKEMVTQGKKIKIKEIRDIVNAEAGYDFSSEIAGILRHADWYIEVEFAKKVSEKGITEAVKHPEADLKQYITQLKQLTTCRAIEALTAGLIARVKRGQDTIQQVYELNKLLNKGMVKGVSLTVNTIEPGIIAKGEGNSEKEEGDDGAK
ncbi:MAG: hypothetical protein DDT33_01701 [Firmicutes bacterium]|nr:hypothetical protein [Bacillota bacterium]